jgi:DNA-binding MarR family transcriptional regulator
MAELSEWLAMERTTLVRNLRPLERDGLVRAKGGARTHVQLAITDKGRATLARTLPAWRAAQYKVGAILGTERWSSLIRDLEQVAAELKKQ